MSSFSPSRSRRIATAASLLTVIVVAAGVLVLVLSVSLPEAWWPRTGQAFAAEDRPVPRRDPCGLIVGPAKEYCKRGTTVSTSASASASASAGRHDVAGAVSRLVPTGAGLAALMIWRGRTTGQGRTARRRGWG